MEFDDDNTGDSCPICMEAWSTEGNHRLVSLKCGHLFGNSCVTNWLNNQPSTARYCPTCKVAASTDDIRRIFARRLVAVYTPETQVLQARIDSLNAEKVRVELDLANTISQIEPMRQQLELSSEEGRRDKHKLKMATNELQMLRSEREKSSFFSQINNMFGNFNEMNSDDQNITEFNGSAINA